ncbi:telomeric repeat-binding factor 2-interacting protein 1 isoform X2 [Melanotaenia boesemani]|uniref:telomeric repeat-binding factor 2-interacting protein 1 isoform X2 n=1 Tax=Melanotaenia boesemani TaxID=1250792 RepID=UPI001C0405E5|nr:telomeric repeat-binding factor 2-interacting protein 1 isoform X2 [Melanotaenia boesemani]
MPPKQQDVPPSSSPVLFLSVDGVPMSFFLRPGPVKCKLQPLITAGGGVLCKIQQPGAILLIDPEEINSMPPSTVHWYVSTKYIYDCIEKGEQLNLEDYRLNPEVVQRQPASLNSSKDSSSTRLSGGRVAYTSEDDAAILNYVSKRKTETGGNRLWQEMEKQGVTTHSWQSMKSRYKDQLAKKQAGVVEVEMAEEDNKAAENTEVETNQEINDQKPSSEMDVAPPQTHSAESDLTQISVQCIPVQTTLVDPQTSNSLKEDEQNNQQMAEQPDESTQSETVKAETSHSLQTEEPGANLQTVTEPDATEPERDGPQTTSSPQKQSSDEESLSAQPESSPKTTSCQKQEEKQKVSDNLEQPQRRVTRRQLELEAASSPEPYGKKLRSSSSSASQLTSTHHNMRKTKSVKSGPKSTADQPPPKRAKGKHVEAVAESRSRPEQSDHDANSEPAQADEANTAPQKAEKRKGKRQLGILELATKEFESDEDDAPDLQNHAETAGTSAELLPTLTNTAADPASTQSIPETRPSQQGNVEGSQTSDDNSVPNTGSPHPAAAEPAVPEPVSATSKAHLFIFESESQEDNSQSVDGNSSAAPPGLRPTVNKDVALSLTQMQLEEDKQRIRELMKQTDQDLVSVTKALLKTSGDFSLALDLLSNPSVSVPLWNRHDNSLLLSADPDVLQQLQEKYGEENVAKRMVFLEVEG